MLSRITCVSLIISFTPMFPFLYKHSVWLLGLSSLKVMLMLYTLLLNTFIPLNNLIAQNPLLSCTPWGQHVTEDSTNTENVDG